MSELFLITLLSWLQWYENWEPAALYGLWAAQVLALVRLARNVPFGWPDLRRVSVETEPIAPKDSWTELGPVRFDPVHGIYGEAMIDGKLQKIVVQPSYWQFLGSAIQRNSQEAAVLTSVTSRVRPGKEPGSLCCVQDPTGRVVGMGVRVYCGPETVFLTSMHVLKAGKSTDLYLAKYSEPRQEGIRILIDPEWKLEYFCGKKEVDIVAVRVPGKIWSRLGVTAATILPLRGRMPVVAYGAQSTKEVSSSQGFVWLEKGFTARHSCSTTPGWSGTPLYHKGQVVGIHREWGTVGVSNIATLIHPFHHSSESSEYEGASVREIDEEEMRARDAEVDDFVVAGRGHYRVSESEFTKVYQGTRRVNEFVRQKAVGDLWSDMEDDWETSESVESSLNSHRAESACPPPAFGSSNPFSGNSTTWQGSTGERETISPRQECPSLSVEDRLLSLEKLVESQQTSLQRRQEELSLLSRTLVGLIVDLKPNSDLSSSKQAVSEGLKLLSQPWPQSESLSATIPESSSAGASSTTTGTPSKSKGKSRKLRQKKSTETPAPASPCT
jgi:hypothetical protein